jgi:hypothetical protein
LRQGRYWAAGALGPPSSHIAPVEYVPPQRMDRISPAAERAA